MNTSPVPPLGAPGPGRAGIARRPGMVCPRRGRVFLTMACGPTPVAPSSVECQRDIAGNADDDVAAGFGGAVTKRIIAGVGTRRDVFRLQRLWRSSDNAKLRCAQIDQSVLRQQ